MLAFMRSRKCWQLKINIDCISCIDIAPDYLNPIQSMINYGLNIILLRWEVVLGRGHHMFHFYALDFIFLHIQFILVMSFRNSMIMRYNGLIKVYYFSLFSPLCIFHLCFICCKVCNKPGNAQKYCISLGQSYIPLCQASPSLIHHHVNNRCMTLICV